MTIIFTNLGRIMNEGTTYMKPVTERHATCWVKNACEGEALPKLRRTAGICEACAKASVTKPSIALTEVRAFAPSKHSRPKFVNLKQARERGRDRAKATLTQTYRVPDDDLPERSGSFTRISGTVVRQIMSKGALVDTPCVRVRCDCGDESFFRRNQWMRPYNRSGCVACKRKKRQAEKDREAGGVLAVYAVRYVGKRSKKGVAA